MSDDWGDLEAEAEAGTKPTHYVCSVGALIDFVGFQQSESARESLVATLKNYRLSTTSIRRALERRVPAVMLPSAWSIGHHRRGQCSCKETS
jgi:hypothetical protein